MRPKIMETPRVLIRPAPAYEPPVGPSHGDSPATGQEPAVGQPIRRDVGRKVLVAREVRGVAVRALTTMLEVIDRRRGAAHLEPFVSSRVRSQIAAMVRAQGTRASSTTVLRRVHVQISGPDAAEVFGSMACGPRVRAFVCRLELQPCRRRPPPAPHDGRRIVEYRWQITTFTVI